MVWKWNFLFVWIFPWIKKCHSCKYWRDLQFKDENHFVFILICIVEVDKLVMMQVIHDINFFTNQSFLHCMWNGDEFGSKNISCFNLAASVNHSKSSCSNFFQDIIIVVHALLGFDINRLRNVLSINIEDELVVVFDLAFLTSDLFTSVRINWN